MVFYQLTRPLSYLFIKDGSKSTIDWLIPAFLAFAFSFLYYALPIQKELYGQDGAMKDLQSFLQMLPGFFLAALAAISTFNKADLDYHLPRPTPEIYVGYKEDRELIKLTRRRMLSYLFGYLTFISLMLYIAVACGAIIAPSAPFISHPLAALLKLGFIYVINLFFWQMIIVTIFGLYQLCDRIHQPDDPEIT